MARKFRCFVVSHTHWDREWYDPYQRFRVRLVDVIDKLMALLERDRGFRSFMLDGQTSVLDDYLEIRPEEKARLQKLCQAGRIVVGPWYVLADEFLASAEALVRDLLIGDRKAREFGGAMKIGYLPDVFGHVGQMPQLLEGFGIPAAVIYRGVPNHDTKTEFWWEAPDGTRTLALYLPMCYGNVAGLSPEVTEAQERVEAAIERLSESATTPNLLLMNGTDHHYAQENLSSLIRALNGRLRNARLKHASLQDYLDAVVGAGPDLETLEGEFRHARPARITPGTISTRMYLKQANAEASRVLERLAEPLAAFAHVPGGDYPAAILRQAWIYLLQNLPHDSICGCSTDAVHRDMEARFRWAQEIGNTVAEQALSALVGGIRRPKKADRAVAVLNLTNWARSEPVAVSVPGGLGENEVLADEEGRPLPTQRSDDGTVKVLAPEVPAYGWRTLTTAKAPKRAPRSWPDPVRVEPPHLENEFLLLTVASDGTMDLLDKRTGETFCCGHLFEDKGDAGDEYNYSPVVRDVTATSQGADARVEMAREGFVEGALRVALSMEVPARLTPDREGRSDESATIDIETIATMAPGVPRLDFTTTVENRAEDHVLRVIFPAPVRATHDAADGQFEVTRRPIEAPEAPDAAACRRMALERGKEVAVTTHPHLNWVDVCDEERGLALLSHGLPEYEVMRRPEGCAIALTLLRCVGWLSREDLLSRIGNAGPTIATPEAQCPGRHTFRYALYPHAGQNVADIYGQTHAMLMPLLAQPVPADGAGRGGLAPQGSLLGVEPNDIVVSAIKKAEDTLAGQAEALIVRVWNPTRELRRVAIRLGRPVGRAVLTDLNEEPTGQRLRRRGRVVAFDLRPHGIQSVAIS